MIKESKFFIWEEKNSIEPKKNSDNKNVLETPVITKNTETKLEKEISNDITEPQWTKKCPNPKNNLNCKQIMVYPYKSVLNKSIKMNRLCSSCKQLGNKYGNKKPYEWLLTTIKFSSKKRHIECSLTYEDILKFTSIKNCHYCNKFLIWSEHSIKGNYHHSNLDRKNNNEGYHVNNLVVCCPRCNYLKNSTIDYNTMIKFGQILKEKETNEN